jgi:hypothetical protein
MANNTRTIYEFSTSIGIKISSDGKWVSTGFQTGWENNTYDSSAASTIPELVRQAIANKEFKLGDNDRSPFAVIGRLVKRKGYKPWAVLAFVIVGVDNSGRNVPLYRYFCCEAENDASVLESMDEILYKVVSYEKLNGELPFFNPQFTELAKNSSADKKIANNITFSAEQTQIISTDIRNTSLVLPKDFIENSAAGNAYTLIKLNMFAWQRALATGQVAINQNTYEVEKIDNFAWAYNVESLECPNSFVVIQTVYGSLKQIGGSSSAKFVSGVNEQGLKAAIKAITEPQQFRPENIIELSTILQDKQLRDVQFLSRIFDDLTGRGILPNTSHPTTIKLFVLRVFLTSSAAFNTFLKWFNQQDPQGKLVNIYKKFEQDFFNTIDDYLNECSTLKEMVSGEVCQAVLESLLVKRDISPESLYVLMQNSRWIKKQNLLDVIRDEIKQVDDAIIANTPFSGADIWKPLERFIEKVQRSTVSFGNPKQRVQSNTELPKWLKNILPEFISDHLGDRWRDINHSQAKLAEAKEQANRLIKAEVYYSPLAELLRMLCPNTDEHLYFDCISNPQKRLPLAYSAIGDAYNTGKKLFNLTIGKPISIDDIENKLIGQQISLLSLVLISVIVIPMPYLVLSIIVLALGSLWNLIKYIFNIFIYILKWIIDSDRDEMGVASNSVKNSIKQQIKKLLSLDYTNNPHAQRVVLDCIESIGKILFSQEIKSKRVLVKFIRSIFKELETEFERKPNSQDLREKLNFFRVYFLSSDPNEISNYLEWFKSLEKFEVDRVLNFQNGFRKILDDIKKESPDRKDYAEPFVKDVINFILGSVIDGEENPTSYKSIIEWIIHYRSYVSSRNLTGYIITDLQQVIRSDGSQMNFLCNPNFWDDLKENWDGFRQTGERKTAPKYQRLARFFGDLGQALESKQMFYQEYKYAVNLSAYFSQVSNGYVSEDILQTVGQEVYGLRLNSKQSDNPNSFSLNPQRSGTERNLSNSNQEKDYLSLILLGITALLIICVSVVVFRVVLFKENNVGNPIVQPQPNTFSNTSGDNSSPSPSPSIENNQTKAKYLNCRASINGEDLDLIISNIPTSAKEINSLMYTIIRNDLFDRGNSLKRYYPPKQPVNKNELTIKNLDGNGSPKPEGKYYIIASTKKLNEYRTVDELNQNIKLFEANQSSRDTCYTTITPPINNYSNNQ